MTKRRAIAVALFGLFASGCAETAKKGPGAELLYVSNEDSGTLSVIDTSALEVVATIPVGRRPRGVRLSPDGARVFVAVSGSPKCPPSVPDEECAKRVADKALDGIAVVDARTRRKMAVLPGGSDPEQFDLSPEGRRLFVSHEDAGRFGHAFSGSGTGLFIQKHSDGLSIKHRFSLRQKATITGRASLMCLRYRKSHGQ